MGNRVKTALVGCGYWGANLLRNLAAHPLCQLVAFSDKSNERLNKTAKLYPFARAFASFDQMLGDTRPDAVVVATPPDSHCALAVQALQAGAHVLIEKPMAKSSAECDTILAAAKKARKQVRVDNTLLFYPPVMLLVHLIQKGELGQLLYYDSIRANLGGIQPTANVLWDLAPHEFSILDLITCNATPENISAVGNKHFGSHTETICYLNLNYPNNFNAHLHLNWAAPVKTRRLTLAGDKKMAELDDGVLTDKLKIYDKSVSLKNPNVDGFSVSYHSGQTTVPVIPQKEALFEMIGEFASCVLENRQPNSDGQAGARVVKMLEAASRSLEQNGQPEKVWDGKRAS